MHTQLSATYSCPSPVGHGTSQAPYLLFIGCRHIGFDLCQSLEEELGVIRRLRDLLRFIDAKMVFLTELK